jgi:hypothetical protein
MEDKGQACLPVALGSLLMLAGEWEIGEQNGIFIRRHCISLPLV